MGTKNGERHQGRKPSKRGRWKRRCGLALLLLTVSYGGSYCLLARAGVLTPGRRSPESSAEGSFAVVQLTPLRWDEVLERGSIDLLKQPQVDENAQRMLQASVLTKVFRPAGYVHQLLAERDAWPEALTPEYSIGIVFPPVLGGEELGSGERELQQGINQMNDFLANDPIFRGLK